MPRKQSHGEAAATTANSRLTTFAWLFAVSTLLYHCQWPNQPTGPLLFGASLLSAFVVLLRPSSVGLFILLALIQVVESYVEMPYVTNNRKLMFFLGSSVLVSAVVALPPARLRPFRVEFLRTFEPLARLQILIAYFFAFLHKLNDGFLDPNLSCAPTLLERILAALETCGIHIEGVPAQPIIYGTLLLEALFVPLLIWKRSRNATIIVAMAFHFVLGLGWHYSYSSTMIAVLYLFAPPAVADDLLEVWRSLIGGRRQRLRRALLCLLAVAVGAAIAYTLLFWETDKPKHWLFWGPVMLPIGLLAALMARSHHARIPYRELLTPRVRPTLLIPLLLAFNALCPYLGLQTKSAFAMYSNLRTEGGRSNHLLIRGLLPLANYQSDLVTITASSDPELQAIADSGEFLPFIALRTKLFELRRSGVDDVSLTYVRNGVSESISNARQHPELSTAPSYFEYKLLRFRVIPGGENACQH